MILYLIVATAVSVVLGLGGGRIAGLMTPSAVVRLLPVLAATCTVALLLSLVAVSTALAGRPDRASRIGAAALAILVLVSLVAGLRHGFRVVTNLRAAQASCRGLPNADGYVLVEDALPDAYAVPGRPGRIVLTTAMRSTLTSEQLAVLLAHERSHLRRRHFLWVQLAESAAVVNPLLRRVPGVVRQAAERWADEEAVVASRRSTAEAIASAALAHSRSLRGRPAPVLSSSGGDVVTRVRALVDPPVTRWSRVVGGGVLLLIVLSVVAALRMGDVTQDFVLPEHEAPHHVLLR